jgi:hypothetical protein
MAAADGRGLLSAIPSINSTSSSGSLRFRIGSFGSYQANQPVGTVAGKPTLSGSEGSTGVTGRFRQRDIAIEVWLEHRKTLHGLLALFFGKCGQSRFKVWLLIHGAPFTPLTGYHVRKRIVERTGYGSR